ncbi:MAG: alpha/beta hydrolase [Rhodobacterales bacterium]|nr:alpha/beta hydrolase [Rhodobacterales bacterium]NCT13158.1 alpha/beta hydrolase [Rhodobacterales bacterium]
MRDLASEALPAPLFDEVADGPAGGVAHWLTTADGLRIRVAQWGAQAPHGTVLLFPGRTEYVEKYGRTAADLLARGFATLTIDWRGQGLAQRLLAEPLLGHVGAFRDYQQDVAAMLAHARAQGLPEPYYLLAHSMGGCIGLRALIEGLPVAAAAFTGPMWGIGIARALRPIAWALTGVSGPLRFDHRIAPGQTLQTYTQRAGFEGNDLTNDRAMFAYMQAQLQAHPELAIGGPTLRWLGEALRETRALARLPSPPVPCLAFLGLEEGIVDAARIRARMADWRQGRLVTLPTCKHEVLMETPGPRAQALADMAAHFLAHR